MNRTSLTIATAVLASILATPALAQRVPRFERENVNGRDAVAREVLVKFRNPLQLPQLADVAAQSDAESVERLGNAGTLRLRSRSRSAAALIQALSRRPDVVYAEPNRIIELSSTPSDPQFAELWGLERISAVPAWELTVGSSVNVVGVIDTGIDYTHPDLAANIWSAPTPFNVTVAGTTIACATGTHGFNAITRQCDPMDDHNHGSHVAGTIGAIGNNGVGVAGVNWVAQMMAIKVFDDQGSATMADVIAGIDFAIAVKQRFQASDGANIRVLSASWGDTEFSQALLDAVYAANDANMLFVAAAGNNAFDNDLLPFYPAAFEAPNVVAVAATTLDDTRAYFSNYGASSVHLGAPGDFILSTTVGNTYQYMSGTSMAAPHVSGAAALVLSECALDTASLKETLIGTVDYLPGLTGTTITGGRVNVNSALHACTGPPATAPSLTARGEDSRVALSWSGVPGALRYDIKRSLTAGGPYASLAPDVKATTYVDSAVMNDTTYYYVISAENTFGESGNSNEAVATPKIPPDLIVSTFTAPAVGGSGSSISISVTTSNIGTGIAGPSFTRIHLSTDTSFDASDMLLAEVPVSGLAPGGASSASPSLLIPAGTAVGRYFLIASADGRDQLVESQDGNNRVSRQLQIGPDLTVSSISAPLSAASGGSLAITDITQNLGGAASAGTTTHFYLSTNTSFSADDVLLGGRAVPAVAAGTANTGTVNVLVPGTMSAGKYYIVAVADGGNVLAETSETNNTTFRLLQVGGDLIVSTITAPATGAPGSSVVVTDTTKNEGAGSVGASTTRFYLSPNATLDATDTLLAGGRAVPELTNGVSHSGSTTLTLPSPLASANYYIIAKADADGQVVESSETNNTTARAIQIGSDLVTSAFTVPATAAAGGTISVTDTITNNGAADAEGSATWFYLSTNSSLDSGDTLLAASRSVPSLAAGASSSGSTSLTLPTDITSASYFLIAKADGNGAVSETNETNNTVTRSIQIGGDLTIAALTVPSRGGGGLPLSVTETTKNQGSGPVPASVTKLYLSTNSSYDSADTMLGQRDVPDLPSGASSTATTTVTIAANIAAGTYYVIARADADASVVEATESNNTLARAVLIGSDLVASVPTTTLRVAAGSSVVLTDTVTNTGGGPSTPSITRFYLSSNSSLDANDVLLEGGRDVASLPVGASNTGSTTVLIPAGAAAGLSYIIAKADGDNTVSEASETNNTSSRAVFIGADLVVSSASAPTSAPAGTTINVTETVTNQGVDAALPTVTRFYLSTNSSFDAADLPLSPGRAVPNIAAGGASTGTTAVTIPATTAAGPYFLITKADGDNTLGEALETNNALARSIQVTAAP